MVKKNIQFVFLIGIFFIVFMGIVSAGSITSDLRKIASENQGEEIPVIVSFKDKPMPEHVQELVNENARVNKKFGIIDAVSAKVPTHALERIAAKPFVEKVEPDYEVRLVLDESVYELGGNSFWKSNFSGKGIDVAVIDTGIAIHDFLEVEREIDFTGEGVEDLHGHGTHVAGIIASKNSKYKGVAYGSDLFNVKVLNKDGSGSGSDVVEGIEWAVNNGAEIISLSLGAEVSNCDGSDAISRAVDNAVNKGVLVVVASGNSGPEESSVASPGCSKEGITVGASYGEEVASFSSRGPTADGRVKPDVVAPGVNIMSTWTGNGFYSLSGTSMATPHVSGAIALMLEMNSSLTAEDIKDVLNLSSRDLGFDENTQGSGKVDLYAAYLYLNFKENNSNLDNRTIEKPAINDSLDNETDNNDTLEEDSEKINPGKGNDKNKIAPGKGKVKENRGIGKRLGLTKSWERIQLTFTFSEEKKAELYLKFSERRLNESLEVAEEDPEKAEELLEESRENLENSEKELSEAKEKGKDVSEFEEKFNETKYRREEVLRRVLENVPEQAHNVILNASNNSKKSFEEEENGEEESEKNAFEKNETKDNIENDSEEVEVNDSENVSLKKGFLEKFDSEEIGLDNVNVKTDSSSEKAAAKPLEKESFSERGNSKARRKGITGRIISWLFG